MSQFQLSFFVYMCLQWLGVYEGGRPEQNSILHELEKVKEL